MSKPPNPITQGLRAVTRDPAIFLVEILWRWSFALLACLLVAGVGMMLLAHCTLAKPGTQPGAAAIRKEWGSCCWRLLLLLGVKVIVAAIAVPLAIALLWSILAALGRFVTVKRLRVGLTSLRFRTVFRAPAIARIG